MEVSHSFFLRGKRIVAFRKCNLRIITSGSVFDGFYPIIKLCEYRIYYCLIHSNLRHMERKTELSCPSREYFLIGD